MAYLLARDTVNGSEGKAFISRNGANMEVAGLRNIHAVASIQNTDMRQVGTRIVLAKSNGVKQTITGNLYYGSSLFSDMVLEYINTGTMPQFDIQITNSDPTTTVGTRVMGYYGCQLTGDIPLSILDSEEAMLNYDFNMTYTRVAKLEDFKTPDVLGQ